LLATAKDLSAFCFSTRDIAPNSRLPVYRELFHDKLAKFDTEPLGSEFRCEASYRALPGLSVLRVAGTPVRVAWTRELVKNGDCDDFVVLAIFNRGKGSVYQHGREIDVSCGSAVVLSGVDPLVLARTSYTYFSIPKKALAPLVADVEAAFMSLIPGTNAALRLLAGYADLLTADIATMTPALRSRIDTHLQDLLALAIGARRDAAESARARGLRAARLAAMQADIEKNLMTGTVRPGVLAARHGVTPRYVHKLFEGEGTTLSRFVLNKRLVLVHCMLRDMKYADKKIGSIAYDAGFGDLSTFNREFRRQYGMTPSDVRSIAQAKEGS